MVQLLETGQKLNSPAGEFDANAEFIINLFELIHQNSNLRPADWLAALRNDRVRVEQVSDWFI